MFSFNRTPCIHRSVPVTFYFSSTFSSFSLPLFFPLRRFSPLLHLFFPLLSLSPLLSCLIPIISFLSTYFSPLPSTSSFPSSLFLLFFLYSFLSCPTCPTPILPLLLPLFSLPPLLMYPIFYFLFSPDELLSSGTQVGTRENSSKTFSNLYFKGIEDGGERKEREIQR